MNIKSIAKCVGKKGYWTSGKAEKIALRWANKTNRKLYVYYCPLCFVFHITKKWSEETIEVKPNTKRYAELEKQAGLEQ